MMVLCLCAIPPLNSVLSQWKYQYLKIKEWERVLTWQIGLNFSYMEEARITGLLLDRQFSLPIWGLFLQFLCFTIKRVNRSCMLWEAKRAVLAKITNTNYSTMALSHAHLYSEVDSPNIRLWANFQRCEGCSDKFVNQRVPHFKTTENFYLHLKQLKGSGINCGKGQEMKDTQNLANIGILTPLSPPMF